MKNTLLTIATALALIFTSCKKTEVPTPITNKQGVTINFKTDKNPSVKALINGQPKSLYTNYIAYPGDLIQLINNGIDSVIPAIKGLPNSSTIITYSTVITDSVMINGLMTYYTEINADTSFYTPTDSVIIRPASTVNTRVTASIVVDGITVKSYNDYGDANLTYTIE